MKPSHEIINDDCLEVLQGMDNASVDLIVTDPPFNIGKKYGKHFKDNRSKEEYIEWCKEWLTECIRVMKPGAALYLFNYPENNAYLVPFLDQNLNFRRWMTWHYPTNTGTSPINFTRTQHSILYYIKGDKPRTFNKDAIAQPYKNPEDKRIKKLMENGSKGRSPYDVFQFNIVKNVSKNKTEHPCQLPEDLIEIFIKASSNPGELVLDPFAGSFTISTVAKKLGRSSIGVELSEKFCEIGKNRLAQATTLNEFIKPKTTVKKTKKTT